MSNNNLTMLANLLEQYYILPYDHDELIELLMKIQDGYMLTKEEYDILRLILTPDGGDSDDDQLGDVIFSGNYADLINKPFIPTKMVDLQDYPTIMARFNQMFQSLSDRDKELADSLSDNARFLSALEILLKQDIDRLTKIVETAKLFQGESLESVIENIQGELGWLNEIKEDIQAGKILSERDFTAAYEEILKSIENTSEGLIGIIKDVIAESIIEPGEPNGDGVYRLDSIGEALATKVDKKYGYGLSQYDFSEKYVTILEAILNYEDTKQTGGIDLSGTLQGYVIDIVDRYEEEFQYMINDLKDRMMEQVENEIQDMKLYMDEKLDSMEEILNKTVDETIHGICFKEYDGPTTIAVGAMNKGTHIANRTMREVLLEILCPFAAPTVSAYLELAPHCSELSMIGQVVEIKGIRANIERGSLPIERVIYKQKIGGQYEVLAAYDTLTSNHWFPDILETTKSIAYDDYMIEVYDTEGHYAYSYVQDIKVVYPIYVGVMDADIDSKTDEELISIIQRVSPMAKYYGSEYSHRYTTKGQRMFIAVPQPYGALTDVYDQNGYIITNSFKSKTISLPFTIKEASSNGEEVRYNTYHQPYFVYYNNPSTITGFDITYKF